MNLIRIAGLASVGFAVLVEPALAGTRCTWSYCRGWFACTRSYRRRILGRSKVFWPKKISALGLIAEQQLEIPDARSAR